MPFPNINTFGIGFNFAVNSLLSQSNSNGTSPPVIINDFLLLSGDNFYLLNDNNFVLLS